MAVKHSTLVEQRLSAALCCTVSLGAIHVQALEEDGSGRVLVVDGGGSLRCALLGDNIAAMAHRNGWSVSCNRALVAPAWTC